MMRFQLMELQSADGIHEGLEKVLVPVVGSLSLTLDELKESVDNFENRPRGDGLFRFGEEFFEDADRLPLAGCETVADAINGCVIGFAFFPVPRFCSASHDSYSVPFC